MFEGMRKFIKSVSSSEKIDISISQTEVTVNGKKIEGEAGAKLVHGMKDVFAGMDKAFDKMGDAFKEADKAFDKVEEVLKPKSKTKGSK